jgi:hypothetical protein
MIMIDLMSVRLGIGYATILCRLSFQDEAGPRHRYSVAQALGPRIRNPDVSSKLIVWIPAQRARGERPGVRGTQKKGALAARPFAPGGR